MIGNFRTEKTNTITSTTCEKLGIARIVEGYIVTAVEVAACR